MSASLNSAQCLAQSKNTITYWKQERAFKNKMTVNYIKTVKEECDPNSWYGCGTISTWWVLIRASSGLSTSSAIPSTATVWKSTQKLSCLKQPFYFVYRLYGSGIWVDDCGDGLSLLHSIQGLSWEDLMAGGDLTAGSWNPLEPSLRWLVVDAETSAAVADQTLGFLREWWLQAARTFDMAVQVHKARASSFWTPTSKVKLNNLLHILLVAHPDLRTEELGTTSWWDESKVLIAHVGWEI